MSTRSRVRSEKKEVEEEEKEEKERRGRERRDGEMEKQGNAVRFNLLYTFEFEINMM